ncbi:cytochrome b5 domain-containing protein [Anaerosacchariphilus polymeriproducens]|uniref:Cytochrome b5 heme-binding domain-containing protein n=1 Tax=Anaerosacchariphilus polymeriproducens TaxID=1812858 RepID=A0A371ASI1_9FIRM|nr:cytochrome b5 domain-containing protein [Anaerosacchariphilus polymeriproducens]RDU22537.1 hypothetical protein DWV06_14745 [Anaerosacchariphilus polymeriproducens]
MESCQKQFTKEELAQYNGKNGNPPYIAVNGIVYDLSSIPIWEGGSHFGLEAGKDLTDEFNQCHYGRQDILQKLPQVGVLSN